LFLKIQPTSLSVPLDANVFDEARKIKGTVGNGLSTFPVLEFILSVKSLYLINKVRSLTNRRLGCLKEFTKFSRTDLQYIYRRNERCNTDPNSVVPFIKVFGGAGAGHIPNISQVVKKF
jgi:hypothetical protein